MEARAKHVVQSDIWGQVKTKNGTPAVKVGNIQYTRHKIPFTPHFFGYCPKVNPEDINFDELQASAEANNCVAVNFDCPNVIAGEQNSQTLENILKDKCIKAPKDTFATSNILLDFTKSEEELLANMHHKTRYNIKYAEKNGVRVSEGSINDIELFLTLQTETAKRQKFFVHQDEYYKTIWKILFNEGMAKLLIARYNGKPLCAWMLFIYEGVLYYPYGGSSNEYQNLFPSNLVCWEAIKLGKALGCHTFDMWGAAKNPEDKNDPWHGFTKFKLGFGGRHVSYIPSYDFVINPAVYTSFNLANKARWVLLKLLKR